MKTIFLIAALIFTGSAAFAQAEAQKPDSLYIVTYTTGAGWDHSKSPGEQLNFKEHSAHLSSLRKSGVITFGARYSDKGIIFIKAESMAHARNIIETDHAIESKLFNADIQKLSVFYPGCVER